MTEHHFVLVHGSWHDGSLWAPVAERLRELGHAVETPTIAGHGKDADKDVSHDDCVRSIVEHIVDGDLEDVVLVGHSFGGNPISGAAVSFTATPGDTITTPTATTDGTGLATVGSWTLGPAPGTNTLTATASGLSGSPVTFTASGT